MTSTPPWGPCTGKLEDGRCQWTDLELTNIEILHRQSGTSVWFAPRKTQFVSEPHAELMDCWHSHLEPSQSSLSRCCHMHSPTVLLDTTPPHDVRSTRSRGDHWPPQSFCSECWGQSASIKASQPLEEVQSPAPPSLSHTHTLQEQGQKWNAPHDVMGQVLHHSLPGPAGVFTAVSLHRTDRSTFNAFKGSIFFSLMAKAYWVYWPLANEAYFTKLQKRDEKKREKKATFPEVAPRLDSEIPIIYSGLTQMKWAVATQPTL